MSTPPFEPRHEPVLALPHPSGTIVHESSCLRTSSNIDADGFAVTALDSGHLQMAVRDRELQIRFRAFSSKRMSTRLPTARPRRPGTK
ncbi:hypothetical protein J2W32_004443 [Variovorax boronicumulans]|uniref:Uncharacterized protein n=1 Tax=Variovorax boronicumulans TaxID=436515 RepID=A0AAW8CYC0_9BURK|nr:hypothetical protein [Variovorax boronicumulans]MDP9895345.1 hypothetical protein [Variovorax boronicumulans]MDQ0055385.1 hypothetical protein [Variovorax boronicumulans]